MSQYPDLDELDLKNMPIPGSSFDVGNNSSTMKTNGMIPTPPPMAMPAPPMAPPVAQSVPQGTMPPAMPGSPAPRPPMPGMADILAQARGAGAQISGQYTPEMRNQLYAALLDRQNSMPNAVGSGLASVGDAIAHGYGRDQTNFLDKTIKADQDTTKSGLEAFDTAQKGSMAQLSAGLEFQKMDPNSAISKVSREAYAPLLGKLGYSPQSMAKMSGANVEAVAKVAAEYGGKEMENLFHQAQLIVEGQFHRAELGEKDATRKADALKTLAEHPVASILPTSANAALKQQAGLAGASGSSGSSLGAGEVARQTKDGKTAIYDESTKQFKRFL